jgi:hypothetical protein
VTADVLESLQRLGIVIATSSNNLFKAGIAVVTGVGAFRAQVAIALAAMAAQGESRPACCTGRPEPRAGSHATSTR